jgi:lipopolysaccharide/colanic/teichoic acid biosynthesis glycosyltransferase
VNLEASASAGGAGIETNSTVLSGDKAAQSRMVQLALKRTLDIVIATTLIVLLLPVMLIIGVLVCASSPGPVIYKQQRLGRNGHLFWFYKFRTMFDDNDASEHHAYYRALIRGDARPIGGSYKLTNDPRVTRVGALLRRYSLDEFPQLFNVLLGHMSLVGPRPPLPYEVDMYSSREWRRLAVRPGLTGLWQVSGRSALSFQQMVDLDIEYIETWNLLLDLRILLRTPLAVVTGDGAC